MALHEQMIELIDSASWFDIAAGGMKCVLENMDLVFAATLESGVRSGLSDRLLSRMNFTIMAHPSEESFVKISVNFEKVWELARGGITRGEVTWMSVLSTGTPTLQSGTQMHV